MSVQKICQKNSIGALFGTFVEYYDYGLFGFSAFVFKHQFFPAHSDVTGLLYSFGAFALGYLAKPLGSIFFSNIGDKFGRKYALMLTILGMCIPTFIIGCLPTYSEIGLYAAGLVVLCRIIQGLFAGGEYDGAALYMLEHAKPNKKGSAASVVRFSGVVGLFCGSLMVNICSRDWMPNWGWRIPFLLSFPLALGVFYLRLSMEETPVFRSFKNKKSASTQTLWQVLHENYLQMVLFAICFGCIGGLYHFGFVFLKNFSMLPEQAWSSTGFSISVGFVIFGLSMLASGKYADRAGIFKTIIIGVSLAFAGLTMITLSFFKANIGDSLFVLLGFFLFIAGVAPLNCLMHAAFYQKISVGKRYRTIGISHTLGSCLISSTTPMVSLFIYSQTQLAFLPFIYPLFLLLIFSLAFSSLTSSSKKAKKKSFGRSLLWFF